MLSHQAVLLSHSFLWRSVCVHFRSVARCQYFQLKPNQIEVMEINGHLYLKKRQKNLKKIKRIFTKANRFLDWIYFSVFIRENSPIQCVVVPHEI